MATAGYSWFPVVVSFTRNSPVAAGQVDAATPGRQSPSPLVFVMSPAGSTSAADARCPTCRRTRPRPRSGRWPAHVDVGARWPPRRSGRPSRTVAALPLYVMGAVRWRRRCPADLEAAGEAVGEVDRLHVVRAAERPGRRRCRPGRRCRSRCRPVVALPGDDEVALGVHRHRRSSAARQVARRAAGVTLTEELTRKIPPCAGPAALNSSA